MKLISIGTEEDTDEDSVRAHIVETLGEHVWDRIVDAVGGLEFIVPLKKETLHPSHRLVASLGMEIALALVEQFGGESIYINCFASRSSARRCQDAIRDGLSNSEIALRLGISERSVRRILSRNGLSNPNKRPGIVGRTRRLTPDDPEFIRRAKVYRQYRQGDIPTHALAAVRLSMKHSAWCAFVQDYRALLEASMKPAAPSHSVSNEGLTGLSPISAPIPHFAPENRVSGP